MKGDRGVITQLNAVLAKELISINQTFLHSRMANDWGFDDFGEAQYKKSIKDMKQADKLVERILFLEGHPNLQDLGKLRIGEDLPEMIVCEMALSGDSLPLLRTAIAKCEATGDYVSRELLEDILEDEEEYLDWLESQQWQIEKTGLQNYLQSQS